MQQQQYTFNGPFYCDYPGDPVKVKPIWILLKQQTVSGSGISWAICMSAPRSRQITMIASHQFFYKPDAIPVARPTVSTQSTEGRCMVLLSCQEIACLDYACYIKIYQASKEYAQTTTAQWTCLPSQRCRSRCEHTRVAKVHNRSKTWPMAITQTSCMWKNCSGVGQEGGSHRIFFKLVKS